MEEQPLRSAAGAGGARDERAEAQPPLRRSAENSLRGRCSNRAALQYDRKHTVESALHRLGIQLHRPPRAAPRTVSQVRLEAMSEEIRDSRSMRCSLLLVY